MHVRRDISRDEYSNIQRRPRRAFTQVESIGMFPHHIPVEDEKMYGIPRMRAAVEEISELGCCFCKWPLSRSERYQSLHDEGIRSKRSGTGCMMLSTDYDDWETFGRIIINPYI